MTLPSEISRDDLLILLASMGVVLPKDTKMPVEELNKRLAQALDTSQAFADLIPKTPVDPTALRLWPKGESSYKATARGNMTETLTGAMACPKKGGLADKEDTFKEMRKSVWTLGCAHDEGVRDVFLRGHDKKWSLYVRILGVYELEDKTPLFYVMYKELVATSTTALEKLEEEMQTDVTVAYNEIGDLERRMLLRLFQQNGKRLHTKHPEVQKKKKWKTTGLQQSFVLPIGPIGMQRLGGHLTDPGCEVCGKKTSSRCLQCLAVVYCECQKADWPTHKETCQSLKGGIWQKVTLSPPPPESPCVGLMNRLDSRLSTTMATVDGPPSEVHGGKIFLAKIQVPFTFGPSPGDMLVYDRQRSFMLFWNKEPNPILFNIARMMMSKGGTKRKIYRWMKHTGGYNFEICMDRAPPQTPAW